MLFSLIIWSFIFVSFLWSSLMFWRKTWAHHLDKSWALKILTSCYFQQEPYPSFFIPIIQVTSKSACSELREKWNLLRLFLGKSWSWPWVNSLTNSKLRTNQLLGGFSHPYLYWSTCKISYSCFIWVALSPLFDHFPHSYAVWVAVRSKITNHRWTQP